MSKHTPGPWSCLVRQGDMYEVVTDAAEPAITERAANARLIEQSPALLADLKALVDWAREHTSPRDSNSPHALLVAAATTIAKATGEQM